MASTAISAQGSTVGIGTASGGAKTITAITVGSPAIATSTAHGFANGDIVTIASVVGTMASTVNTTWVVTNVTANTFALANSDTSGLTYTSGGTATPVTWTSIANVKSFSGFDGSASEIDITYLGSTAKEFKLGLIDPGHFSIQMDQDNTDAGQTALRAAQTSGASKQFKLTLPNSKTATFNGFVKKIDSQGGVDAVVKNSVEMRITGAITWA
jgi:hypothetical protein